jgi:alkyl hydroperoxide reductase subunit F
MGASRIFYISYFYDKIKSVMLYDLIIIGAGPAGLTAAIYASRKKMNTLILTEQIGNQSSAAYEIENFPGFLKIKGAELNEKMREQVAKYGVPIKEGMAISGIKKKGGNFLIKLKGGENFETKTVIIASGRKPKKLELPGAKEFEAKGVSFCTVCDAPIFAGKDVAIIGGGNAAMASARDLVHYASRIYILQHREKFTADEINIEKLKNTGKVHFLVNAEAREIKGKQFVEGIVYENLTTGEKKELKVGGVFINIGQIPNTDFVKGFLKLSEKGEIIIDGRTNETSVPGIFAAGDVSDGLYKQCVVAAAEGAKAALSAYHYICNC